MYEEDYDEYTSPIDPMEMEEYGEEMKNGRGEVTVFAPAKFYNVLDQNTARNERYSAIRALMSEFGLPENSALKALKLTSYCLPTAKKRFLDDDRFFSRIETVVEPDPNSQVMQCLCCFSKFDRIKDGYAMPCNHFFCRSCFSDHVNAEFETKSKGALDSTCPMPKCNHLLTESTFQKFLTSDKYNKLLLYSLQNYMDDNKSLKWCPGPKCQNIFQFRDPNYSQEVKNISCSCGYVSCTSCTEEGHVPLSCELMTKWKSLTTGKYSDISEKWIQLYTKKCPNPKCLTPIEKNQGCMHMTCKKCTYEFCWICLGDWKEHVKKGDPYNCRAFVVDDKKKDAELDLKKYEFYSERYFEHLKSVKKAQGKKPAILQKFQEICFNLCLKDMNYDFLVTALDGIIESRRLVAYTYPVGYFTDFKRKDSKTMFEYMQSELEGYLEMLDKLTDTVLEEKPADMQNEAKPVISNGVEAYAFKAKVEDMCKALGKYFSSMMDYFAHQDKNYIEQVPSPATMKQDKIEVEENQMKWKCGTCTFFNDALLTNCEICINVRGNAPLTYDWLQNHR